MEGEPSVENMAGPLSINQRTLLLPKPNWPADALATSGLYVEINHTESEVGTCQLHWMYHFSLCSPWMQRCVSLCGSLPHKQQTEQLTELHTQTIMERARILCTNAVAEFFLFDQMYIYFVANRFNPLAWSSIDALTALIILHCGTEEVEDKGEGNVYDQTVISFPWE